MGSNNRLDGKLLENSGGRATLEVMGGPLTGLSRTKATAGEKATGIIRIERVHCASAGPNRVKMELKAPMYLGERWELVFARDNITVRAYARRHSSRASTMSNFRPKRCGYSRLRT